MTIALDRLLKHMAWANKSTIEHLEKMPNESLRAFATNSDWHVAEIMHHIVESADFYYYRITGEHCEVPGDGIAELVVVSDLQLLKEQCSIIDEALLSCVGLEDIQVEFKNREEKIVKRWRSTILSQAIHHATEHRAQIASALEAKGFEPVDLDDLDLWSFEIKNG